MKAYLLCILLVASVRYATAQQDTTSVINRDSVIVKILPVPPRFDPVLYPYMPGYNNKKTMIPWKYSFVPGKKNSVFLDVSGSLMLGYLGYKTNHTYYYRLEK